MIARCIVFALVLILIGKVGFANDDSNTDAHQQISKVLTKAKALSSADLKGDESFRCELRLLRKSPAGDLRQLRITAEASAGKASLLLRSGAGYCIAHLSAGGFAINDTIRPDQLVVQTGAQFSLEVANTQPQIQMSYENRDDRGNRIHFDLAELLEAAISQARSINYDPLQSSFSIISADGTTTFIRLARGIGALQYPIDQVSIHQQNGEGFDVSAILVNIAPIVSVRKLNYHWLRQCGIEVHQQQPTSANLDFEWAKPQTLLNFDNNKPSQVASEALRIAMVEDKAISEAELSSFKQLLNRLEANPTPQDLERLAASLDQHVVDRARRPVMFSRHFDNLQYDRSAALEATELIYGPTVTTGLFSVLEKLFVNAAARNDHKLFVWVDLVGHIGLPRDSKFFNSIGAGINSHTDAMIKTRLACCRVMLNLAKTSDAEVLRNEWMANLRQSAPIWSLFQSLTYLGDFSGIEESIYDSLINTKHDAEMSQRFVASAMASPAGRWLIVRAITEHSKRLTIVDIFAGATGYLDRDDAAGRRIISSAEEVARDDRQPTNTRRAALIALACAAPDRTFIDESVRKQFRRADLESIQDLKECLLVSRTTSKYLDLFDRLLTLPDRNLRFAAAEAFCCCCRPVITSHENESYTKRLNLILTDEDEGVRDAGLELVVALHESGANTSEFEKLLADSFCNTTIPLYAIRNARALNVVSRGVFRFPFLAGNLGAARIDDEAIEYARKTMTGVQRDTRAWASQRNRKQSEQ